MEQDRAQPSRRGRLKVFLGAAAGVGKTYTMLGEARDLNSAGVDVVIGYLEPHGRRGTELRAGGLEVAPRRTVRIKGRPFTDLDLEWLLERAPQLCLVDELAHTNHPGGRNAKRWQDATDLLAEGVDVYTTVNIQHLESLNDKIFEITGVRIRETFPDRLLHTADEVVLVDIPPEALRERIAHGQVYAADKIPVALANFFTVENLTSLRALALREVAEQEEGQLQEAAATEAETPALGERVMVCVDGRPNSTVLVRKAARVARRASGRLYLLHVEPEDEGESEETHAEVATAERLARSLDATVLRRAGNVAAEVAEAARELGITQIFLGESHRPRWKELLGQSIIAQVLRDTDGVDIHIIADERERTPRATAPNPTGPGATEEESTSPLRS